MTRTRANNSSFTTMATRAVTPRPLPRIIMLGLVPVASWFIVRPFLDPVPALPGLFISIGFSIFSLLATLYLVPALGPTFIQAHLSGRDLLKVYSTPMYVLCTRNTVQLLIIVQTRKLRPCLRIRVYSRFDPIHSICLLRFFDHQVYTNT